MVTRARKSSKASESRGEAGEEAGKEGGKFRAEKRSAQASAHPIPQAQGGLFCVMTVLVCCWSSE